MSCWMQDLIEKENQKIPEAVRSMIETLGYVTNSAIVVLLGCVDLNHFEH